MDYIVNVLIVVTSLIILYFAYFKKSTLGKYSVYVIFASLLLQEFLGILVDWSLFDFMRSIINGLVPFVIYGELVILIILLVQHFKKSNKVLRTALLILTVLKLIAVLGIL